MMESKQMFVADHAGVVSMQKNRRKRRRGEEIRGGVKVVYISNPLRVTLTASEFKERVQQLTGQDSDVGECMWEKSREKTSPTVEIMDDISPFSGKRDFDEDIVTWMNLCFEMKYKDLL